MPTCLSCGEHCSLFLCEWCRLWGEAEEALPLELKPRRVQMALRRGASSCDVATTVLAMS